MRPLVNPAEVTESTQKDSLESKDEQISLKEHIDHMKEGQNEILEEIVDPEDPPLNNSRETLHQKKILRVTKEEPCDGAP